MRKIKKRTFKSYPMTTLFYEDIEEIYHLIKKNCDDIELKVGDYILDDISEISQLNEEKTNYLYISGNERNPEFAWITVEFKKDGASIVISDKASIKLYGIEKTIEEIIQEKRRKYTQILSSWYLCIFAGIISVTVSILYYFLKHINPRSGTSILLEIISLIIPSLIALYVFVSLWIRRKEYSKLYLIKKNNKNSFISRNKDQIILLIVGSIIGSIITILISLITSWLTNSH